MKTTNIYTLSDPRTNKVRYVGKANNISKRFRAHLNTARDHQTHKKNWIEELKKEGLKPVLEIIDVVSIEEWVFWEIFWISQFKTWGFELVNNTYGGDGCTFGNKTSFKKGQGGKKVIGFNSNYEKKYEFNTAIDATNFLKLHPSSIPCCCSKICRLKTIKKITWFYYDDIINLSKHDLEHEIKKRFIINRNLNSNVYYKGQKSPKAKKVLMFDLNWNLIRKFESAKLAGEYIGVTGGSIQHACTKSKKSICKNYKWKYEK